MEFNIGDIIRDKKTGACGKIISISKFIDLIRIDCGGSCVWVDTENVEKVEILSKE